MLQAPLPANEADRLAALHDFQILDTPPDDAFDRITRIASRILKMPIAIVSLVDKERQWFKSHLGVDTQETPREVAFCAHAICEQDVMVIQDAVEDQRFSDNPLVTEDPKIRFYAGAPLQDNAGHILGALCVIDRTPRQIDEDQRAVLRDLASIVMDAMHLRRLAAVDPLTGLPNRRHFLELCEQENRRACRYGNELTVGLLDIDCFKQINDQYGHDAGDAVLKAMSYVAGQAVREHDTVCRYGGEEFALLMPHATLDQAEAITGRLRELVSEEKVDVPSGQINFTISAGVTPFRVGEETIHDALKRADQALYDAKAQGRNRVICAPASSGGD